jgi:hypothetical protein
MPKYAAVIQPSQLKSKLQESKSGVVAVGGVPGLCIRRTSNEAQSWVFRGQVGSRRCELGLGSLKDVSLAQARERARLLRQQLADGKDPVAERKQQKLAVLACRSEAKTFEQCAREFLAKWQEDWKNPKHRAQWLSTLETYAFPMIGSMDVEQLRPAHIQAVLEQPCQGARSGKLWEVKTETASRLQGRICRVVDYAIWKKYRKDRENPAQWTGRLANELRRPSKLKAVEHHPAVPVEKMPEFLARLRGQEGVAVNAD